MTAGSGNGRPPRGTRRPADRTGWSERLSPLVRAEAAHLTGAERKLADALFLRYPEAALLSARALASEAGTSAASVSRFARKLGYADYAELQSQLAVELRARLSSPPKRLGVDGTRRQSVGAILREVIARDRANLDATLHLVDEDELDRLARRLCQSRRSSRVYVAGSKKGAVVAHYFAMQLSQLRSNVVLLTIGDLADQVLDMSAADILVLFEPRRATTTLMRLLDVAHSSGLPIAAFTDELPPAAFDASEFLFRTKVDAVSVFDSYAAMFALCDAILAFIVHRMPKAVRSRAERLEELNDSFATFFQGGAPPSRQK